MSLRLPLPVLLVWLLAATLRGADADDFLARFQKARADQDKTQTAAILEEWKRAKPDDPEYFIAAANDLLDRDSGVLVSRQTTGQGDFVVTDPKTGRPVGSIGQGTPSADTNRKAVELLKKGLEKAPARLDIYPGIAVLYERLEDTKALLADLSAMAAYAKAHPDAVFGTKGKPYPKPVDENLAHEINNIAHRTYARENEAANRTFLALAKFDAENFPASVYGHNLLGIYYSVIEKKPKLALANYQRALKIAPNDSLVWINVGVIHRIAGEKKEAAAAFNKVVALNNDEDCVE